MLDTPDPNAIPILSTTPDRIMPEAEALCHMVGELGLILGVNLTNSTIFATVGENAKPGALDVLTVISKRAANDEAFCEDVIAAVGTMGFYLADAPGFNVDARIWPAEQVVAALARVGLLIRHHYEAGDTMTPMLSFMPVEGVEIHPNAHLLMRLVTDRFSNEPDFSRDMTRLLAAAGQSQHNA